MTQCDITYLMQGNQDPGEDNQKSVGVHTLWTTLRCLTKNNEETTELVRAEILLMLMRWLDPKQSCTFLHFTFNSVSLSDVIFSPYIHVHVHIYLQL